MNYKETHGTTSDTGQTVNAEPGITSAGRARRVTYLLRHRSVLTLSDQVIVSLTNFSTSILLGHFCSKSELGLYMLGYSLLLFAVALQQMLISSPFILHWPRLRGDAARRYTWGAYTEQLVFAAVLCLVLVIASLVARIKDAPLFPVLLAFAFAAPCFLLKEMYRRVCFTQLKASSALYVDAGVASLQIILLLALLKTHHLSAATGVVCVGIANLVLAAGLALGSRPFQFSRENLHDVVKKNWGAGRWIFGSQVLWASCLYAYPWLITKTHGTAAAGTWAACFGINALGNPLMLGLQSYIEPRVSHAYASDSMPTARRLVWRLTIVLLVSMLLFSALIAVVGDKAVSILYGAKYAGNGLTIFLITLGYAIGGGAFAFSCGFFASGRGKLDYLISWVYPVIFLCCGIPFVNLYGIVGGALAIVLANTLSTILRGFQFHFTFRRAGLERRDSDSLLIQDPR
jgi:O-antigen/teichoic acid export membrane protein